MKRLFWEKEDSSTNVYMWILLSFLERLFTEHVPTAPIYGSSSAYNVESFLDLTFSK